MPAKKASKKTTTKKAATSKPAYTAKNLAIASLGFYGKIFDEIQSRVEVARKHAPKQFDELVKRGEKAQKELTKSGEEISKTIRDYDMDDAREDLEELVGSVRESLTPAKA